MTVPPPTPTTFTTRKEILLRRSEIALHAPLKSPETLTPSWEDIPHNTQVGRFMLLDHLLKQASLCPTEIQSFLSRYIHTLSQTSLQQLHLHLPNVNLLHRRDFTFDPSLGGISQDLGPKRGPRRNPPIHYLGQALISARLHVIGDPVSFYHVDEGWFLVLAQDLSHRAVYIDNPNSNKGRIFSHREEKFWFGELENAVWLGVIARLTLLSPDDEYLAQHKLAIKESWRIFFNVFSPPYRLDKGPGSFNNNNRNQDSCTCPDKEEFALPNSEDYFAIVKPRNLGKQHAHGNMKGTLLKVLDAIDAVPESQPGERQQDRFQLSDLYTTSVEKARPVRRNVFEKLHYCKEFLEILEGRLLDLTLECLVEVGRFNVRDFGYSAYLAGLEEEN